MFFTFVAQDIYNFFSFYFSEILQGKLGKLFQTTLYSSHLKNIILDLMPLHCLIFPFMTSIGSPGFWIPAPPLAISVYRLLTHEVASRCSSSLPCLPVSSFLHLTPALPQELAFSLLPRDLPHFQCESCEMQTMRLRGTGFPLYTHCP